MIRCVNNSVMPENNSKADYFPMIAVLFHLYHSNFPDLTTFDVLKYVMFYIMFHLF